MYLAGLVTTGSMRPIDESVYTRVESRVRQPLWDLAEDLAPGIGSRIWMESLIHVQSTAGISREMEIRILCEAMKGR